MQQERIKYLTEKFFNKESSKEEMQELAVWIEQNPDDELAAVLEHVWERYKAKENIPDNVSDRILANIFLENKKTSLPIYPQRSAISRLWPGMAAAAAVIFLIGFYWYSRMRKVDTIAAKPDVKVQVADLPPGGNKAILTLGDGSNIVLDSTVNGDLPNQGATSITRSGNGAIVYKSLNGSTESIVFNTIRTPRGGQYQIVLTDGSHVWLNAASSIRFPTAFAGQERRVTITGEAYFEVAKNSKKPFIVTSGEEEIKVLGTHFNVMAYEDEDAVKTTLLEGSVLVSQAGRSVVLSPGQQASVSQGSSRKVSVLNGVDVEKEMAWKNGYFQFENENLESVMRQVSRWYDVDVTYEGTLAKDNYTGRLPRNSNISKVFKILSLTGIKCRIEGRTIIVTP
ncbi:MAG: FecR domain-containing protein [Dyadobacter sp.]